MNHKMSKEGISTDSLKSFLESHLTSLHGTINSLDIDELTGVSDGFHVLGTFKIPWGKKYSFDVMLGSNGGLESYKREEIPEY